MPAMRYLMEADPLELGADVRAVGLELVERATREPPAAAESAPLWAAALEALAGKQPWALDFFAHLDRVRDWCARHGVPGREAAPQALVLAPPEGAALAALLERFATETFGARCGGALPAADAELEGELSRRGVDAYHAAYARYTFCGVCDLASGFLTVLSAELPAREVVRRLVPALAGRDTEVRLSAPET